MNIGFDIDGVLTNIENFQIEEGKKHFKTEVVNPKGFSIKEMFGCTEKEEYEFWKKNILKYSIAEPAREGIAEVIKKLRTDGNKIHIITSRYFTDKDNVLGKVMRTIVREWLIENGIEYDDIVFCGEDKSDAIKDKYISVMVEDNPDNIKKLSNLTDVISVKCNYNRDIHGQHIVQFDPQNISELYDVINSIKDKNKKSRIDPITVLSGIPSIDKPHLKHYSELQTRIQNPEISIYEYLKKCNSNNLDSKAISYFGNSLNFSEFFNKIDECAKGLKKLGVEKGEIVTVCMPNTPEGIITFYAINKIGAVANMIHPLSGEKEISDYINQVKSKVMIIADICYDKVKNIADSTTMEKCVVSPIANSMPLVMKTGYSIINKKVEIDDSRFIEWNTFIKNGKTYNGSIESKFDKNEMAVLLHTGGSTGIPKAVMLSNENFNTNVEQLKFTIPSYEKGDSLLAITPIFHGFGLANCVHTALCVNMSVSLLPKYDEKLFTNTLIKDKSNLILGVPTLWDAMMKNEKLKDKDLSFLKVLISGGDNLPINLENEMNSFLQEHNAPNPIFKGYGMTESLAASSFSQPNVNEKSSVGIPLPQNNYKIVKPNTTDEVDFNEEGEICVNGPTVMLGYYENPEETDNVLKTHPDGKKWLHTGDMGYRNEDGVLFYTQRIKRIIISSGYNIYPNQIEEIIKSHPSVNNCVVVGIPHQAKVNVPKAYILLNENENKENVSEEIEKMCKENLAKFSLPKEYEYVRELPKTLMGKVDYKLLEQQNIDKYYKQTEKSAVKVKK